MTGRGIVYRHWFLKRAIDRGAAGRTLRYLWTEPAWRMAPVVKTANTIRKMTSGEGLRILNETSIRHLGRQRTMAPLHAHHPPPPPPPPPPHPH